MYAVYLGSIRLPVTPGKIQTKVKNQNKTVTLINDGEVNILKAPGLTEISFDAMFPAVRYPFAVYEGGFKSAEYFVTRIGNMKTKKKAVRFILTRISPDGTLISDVNMRVAVEDYTIKDDVSEGMDIVLSIKLKQYKEYGTRTVKVKTTITKTLSTSTGRPADSAPSAGTHKVVKGDCLWNIAQQYLGDGNRYMEIYNLNKSIIDKGNAGTGNPRFTIYPGQVFSLPAK